MWEKLVSHGVHKEEASKGIFSKMSNIFLVLFALVAVATSHVAHAIDYTADAVADRVLNLPGADHLTASFGFSGYLAINGSTGLSKMQHYWMQESQNAPETAPLVFWTNGYVRRNNHFEESKKFFTEEFEFRSRCFTHLLTSFPYLLVAYNIIMYLCQ
jgi:hypothetical protein